LPCLTLTWPLQHDMQACVTPPCAGSSPQVSPGGLQALSANMSGWMLVDQSLVTLDGSECNKIGVGFSAFRYQPVRAPQPLSHHLPIATLGQQPRNPALCREELGGTRNMVNANDVGFQDQHRHSFSHTLANFSTQPQLTCRIPATRPPGAAWAGSWEPCWRPTRRASLPAARRCTWRPAGPAANLARCRPDLHPVLP